ncbi:hypothetical protein FHX81_7431 [Saccharothrix saharensis]|uniref:Uncharacterized protein n=1 Tax=Saccharothrix saharensis TaxID=571190 RepID=A0A543JQE1_9PSEU|nr:hypothetical protein [Saccharothrix saharensis]TQM84965.1 hypothetical protein FHX81_7431 [Saccharothrix saharensis]
MIEPTTVVRQDRAALRRVVDLALRGIRAKAHPPHAGARGQHDARWVMSSAGVIDAPAVHWEHQPAQP